MLVCDFGRSGTRERRFHNRPNHDTNASDAACTTSRYRVLLKKEHNRFPHRHFTPFPFVNLDIPLDSETPSGFA
jgi:hypothetical protein